MFSLEKHSRLAALIQIENGTAIALVMALVAMFGAIAALRAGNAEEDSDVLESKLSQRHLIELTLRKEYNEREGQLFHFDDDYGALVAEGRRLRSEADALRNADPAGAARRGHQSFGWELAMALPLPGGRHASGVDAAGARQVPGAR